MHDKMKMWVMVIHAPLLIVVVSGPGIKTASFSMRFPALKVQSY